MNRPSGKNENCLAGMVCPKCGQEDKFIIEVTTLVSLTDDGTDPYDSDIRDYSVDWTEDSFARCSDPECEWEGIVKDLYPEEESK